MHNNPVYLASTVWFYFCCFVFVSVPLMFPVAVYELSKCPAQRRDKVSILFFSILLSLSYGKCYMLCNWCMTVQEWKNLTIARKECRGGWSTFAHCACPSFRSAVSCMDCRWSAFTGAPMFFSHDEEVVYNFALFDSTMPGMTLW